MQVSQNVKPREVVSRWNAFTRLILFRTLATWTSLVAQMVKCLPTMRETQVQTLGQEDLLEKEMGIHSSIHAWKFCGQESLVYYSP